METILIIIIILIIIAEISGDCREDIFLFQQLSVLIHRYNAVLLRDSFIDEEAGTGIPA